MRTDASVVRGPESWNYIYVFLGFALAMEGTTIGMFPLSFPWNIIVFGILVTSHSGYLSIMGLSKTG